MSIHKRVLRVTDEADEKTRAHAEKHGIGVYDAATLLIMREDGNKGAESSALTVPEPTALRVRVYAESLCIDPGEAVGRLVELAFLPREPVEPDPRVTAYAEETSATYADALDKLVRLGISRARALDKHAAGKRAA